jgi:steroid 5-alpha reductase family enzyme
MIIGLLQTTLAVLGVMCLGFAVAYWKHNNSVADICWGLCFIAAALVSAKHGAQADFGKSLLNTCLVLWGLRLAAHIAIKNHGRPEDARYAAMRRRWAEEGHEVLNSFLWVFMLQGVLVLVIASPIVWTNLRGSTELGRAAPVGFLLWLAGFLCEAIADAQRLRFRVRYPKRRLLTSGLWRWSRHPNYFGEIILWWGIFLMAARNLSDLPLLISPICITILLLRVSGVPMAEARRRQDPDYASYMRNTPAVFPRFFYGKR